MLQLFCWFIFRGNSSQWYPLISLHLIINTYLPLIFTVRGEVISSSLNVPWISMVSWVMIPCFKSSTNVLPLLCWLRKGHAGHADPLNNQIEWTSSSRKNRLANHSYTKKVLLISGIKPFSNRVITIHNQLGGAVPLIIDHLYSGPISQLMEVNSPLPWPCFHPTASPK
jgi:hypothetical protein